MEILSRKLDKRINSYNLYVETTVSEYLTFAKEIIKNNELQRKRVRSSKTVYSLLKNDLKQGCIMPPLVLAMIDKPLIDPKECDNEKLYQCICENTSKVMILDGLQRTYTLLDAESEMKNETEEKRKLFLETVVRLELFFEINKFGILYRMLTLNSGQTPMSARHQLEMLYSDLLNTDYYGVTLVTEKEGPARVSDNEFVFKNVIEGFYSYMSNDSSPIDRLDMLENIKMLENMASENMNTDAFKSFLETYTKVFRSFNLITDNHVISDEELEDYYVSTPFGRKTDKVFSTSQAMTGFGAAMAKLKEKKLISSFDDVNQMIDMLVSKNTGYEWLLEMLTRFEKIRNESKKIGNSQRLFFAYFFRELFNRESDSFLDLLSSVENGYKKYDSQVN